MIGTLSRCLVLLAAVGVSAAPAPQQLPDFDLIQPNGTRVSFLDQLRPANVVFFWATWCTFCRQELLELQNLDREHRAAGLAVVTVNLDGPGRPVEPFLRHLGVSLPVYTLDSAVERALGLDIVPLTLLVDGKGRVVYHFVGYDPGQLETMVNVARNLLKVAGGGAPPEGE